MGTQWEQYISERSNTHPQKEKNWPPWMHVGATEFQKDHEKSGHGLDLEWNILCHGVPRQGILAWARGPTP
jgi:hypothetical protein